MRVSLAFLPRRAVAAPFLAAFAACTLSAPPRTDPLPPSRTGGVAPGPSALSSAGPAANALAPQAPAASLFDPPPMEPQPPPPPPPIRPSDKVPSPPEQARKIADCARFTSCQDCVEAHKCGYCPDTGTCTPGDLFGPYPGTCSGAWAPMQCTLGPRDAAKHDAETRAALQKQVQGFTTDGAPIDHAVKDARSPVTFQVRRGRCYQITLRLSGDVDERWDLKPVAIPHVVYYEGGQALAIAFDGYAIDKLCPQQDGAVDVYLATERARKGAWRAQLWSAPIEDAELVRQRDLHETAERRARVSTWCRSCVVEWARCRVAGEPRCAASYFQCLAAARLTSADCERGDTAPGPAPRPTGPFNEARFEGGGVF